MEQVVQWVTIFSPIIAVVIAVWTSRSSAKDTAKKIAALEESTTKQVESIKELTQIQIDLSIMQLEKEATETRAHFKQTSKRFWDDMERDNNFNSFGPIEDSWRQRDDKRRDLTDKQEYDSKHLQDLSCYLRRLNELKEKVGGK